MFPRRLSSSLVACAVLSAVAFAQSDSSRPVAGIREKPVTTYALTHATLVPRPGETIEDATLLFREGVIVAVGKDVELPADARIVDATGKTIYAGFLDAYGEVDAGKVDDEKGTPHWNPYVTPQRRAIDGFDHDEKLDEKLRGQGVVARLVAPDDGILKGTSGLVATAELDAGRDVFAGDVAQHLRLTVDRGNRKQYPNSPMGAVALARQTFLDADWSRRAWQTFDRDPAVGRPETNDALAALEPYLDGNGLLVVDAEDEQYALRADRFAREFDLQIALRGSGHEYRRLDAIREAGRAVIVPLNFPKPPDVSTTAKALDVSLERLMHWDHAPENPARLAKAGVAIAFTTHGLKDRDTFLKQLRTAVRRGLPQEDALRSLTVAPAELFGVAQELGTLAAGKSASFVVTDGKLFDDSTKVLETWVAGERFEVEKPTPLDLRGTWKFELGEETVEVNVAGSPGKLSGKLVREKDEIELKSIELDDTRLALAFDGDVFDRAGRARLSAIVTPKDGAPHVLTGHVDWPDGTRTSFTAKRTEPFEEAKEEEKDAEPVESASFSVNFPLGAFGRAEPPKQPQWVVFRNATIWTGGKAGVIENGTLVVKEGRIHSVSKKDVDTPPGAVVVDCEGGHLTPGLIDCHSHFATDGGVNESTQAITAEVRIGDFVDATDVNVYRQLAGGVTSSNILHGSANPIGGQNQVVKLRWGALPEDMKFSEAPQGIKFALGENVKQSNWGDDYTSRYPQTRMGVEQLMRDAFEAAKDYRARHAAWQKDKQGLPPRIDLELEALAEILEEKRWIHCHSYRQDEILALIRTLDDYGVTIGTFQHILEGYKVAEAMAKHGAMGSAFSDWWAYKLEVYDAIPYNGAIMHRQGVVVSFNSDDRELARRLNQEAAKAVKYGQVPPEEALKFVTLNPAKQLRIDEWVGSLEKGKHADVVLWNADPLSNAARVEQTWVDGRRYFDRDDDVRLRDDLQRTRATLIQKALSSGEEPAKPEEEQPMHRELWPRVDEFCTHSKMSLRN